VGKRNLEAFVYHVSFYTLKDGVPVPVGLTTHAGSLKLLWDLGFRSPEKEKKVFKGIDAVIRYVEDFEATRDELHYEIDGMVIKVNDFALHSMWNFR
jgi:DNA ligase (NAD+)